MMLGKAPMTPDEKAFLRALAIECGGFKMTDYTQGTRTYFEFDPAKNDFVRVKRERINVVDEFGRAAGIGEQEEVAGCDLGSGDGEG